MNTYLVMYTSLLDAPTEIPIIQCINPTHSPNNKRTFQNMDRDPVNQVSTIWRVDCMLMPPRRNLLTKDKQPNLYFPNVFLYRIHSTPMSGYRKSHRMSE